MVVVGTPRERVWTGSSKVGLSLLHDILGEGIRHPGAKAVVMMQLCVDVGPSYLLVGNVGIHLSTLPVAHHRSRGDVVAEEVIIAGGRQAVFQIAGNRTVVGPRERQVMVGLALQVRITIDHEDASHKEIHIEFLERGGTEARGVGGTQTVVSAFPHTRQFPRGHTFCGSREIVVTQSADNLPLLRGGIVPLHKGVVAVLRLVVIIGGKLIGHQVVVHEVGTQDKLRVES